MPISSGSVFAVIKPKSKCRYAVTILFCVVQEYYRN